MRARLTARREISVSRLLGDLLKERMQQENNYDRARCRALTRKPFMRTGGHYLSGEEADDLHSLRRH
ncbi:MAG TPA: hypothetical protein VEG30_13590 [Terriglobales bacterium]|nr:hypothetical protein [Terriglobales bacterium]